MVKTQKEITNPFFVRKGRVMISLGPLSKQRKCPYDCAFCYSQGGFKSYAKMEIKDIVSYLDEVRNKFDIIYVSGDTDSFAPPRTKKGLALLNTVSTKFDCDLLFTTRTIFDKNELAMLGDIQKRLARKNRTFFGCISISRLHSAPHIEPKPIPNPQSRVEMLQAFKQLGLVSVLALRPFLPIIPISEYINIVSVCQSFVDFVLGEVWYVDQAGVIERRVFKGGTPIEISFTSRVMDFGINKTIWKVWEATDVERHVHSFCDSIGLPFFMRSKPAVEFMRNKKTSNEICR